VPAPKGHCSFKRIRDDSNSEHSWQKSFKRLKVMEDDADTSCAGDTGGYHNSVTVVNASNDIRGECPLGSPLDTAGSPQNAQFVPRHGHEHQSHSVNYGEHCQTSHHENPRTTQHFGDSALVNNTQVPGQGSAEINHFHYQSVNSLLGSLHRTRRRHLSGAGQSTDTSLNGQHENCGVNMPSQQPSLQQPPTQSHTDHLVSQRQHLGTGGATLYFRPAKKKNISLLVDSNLY
jgi:hypothetical protein